MAARVANEELVERETTRCHLGNEGGQPEDVRGDLVDRRLHDEALSFARNVVLRRGISIALRSVGSHRAIPHHATPILRRGRRSAVRGSRRQPHRQRSRFPRLRTPSLASTRPTWCSAVFAEMNNRSAIWALVRPMLTSCNTSRSRFVKTAASSSLSWGRDRPVSPSSRRTAAARSLAVDAPRRSKQASAARASLRAPGVSPAALKSDASSRRTRPSWNGRSSARCALAVAKASVAAGRSPSAASTSVGECGLGPQRIEV